MTNASEICIIAPSRRLAENARKTVGDLGGEIGIYTAAMEEAADIAPDLVARGARVLISRKGTKAMLEKVVSVPVVGITYTLEDYVIPLQGLRGTGLKVGFLTYEDISTDVAVLCRVLDMDIGTYRFTSRGDTEDCVRRAVADGVQVGIGGASTAKYAEALGIRHIVMENAENSIRSAIATARQILAVQKEEARKQEELSVRLERYQLIFNYTHDAIIAINRDGKIDVLNQVAEQIINAEGHKPFIGKNIDDVLVNTRMMNVLKSGEPELDQLMNINGTLVSTNRIPIVVDGVIHGVVATFQDVKHIQDSEQKIRIKMHEKGLFAKYSFHDITGQSPAIQSAKKMAASYAAFNSTILIRGETGTGKELFAQSIHRASQRSASQFVAVNCAALPKNLLEAELFGYVDGAFTGAVKGGKAGLFELAHGGTIFLDEIGELAIDTQVQLLRVLQEKEIRRIGSDRVTPVDIRIISATNRDLERAIAEGRFRQDLFYRLNVLNIYVPALREREEDIPDIARIIFRQQAGGEFPALEGRLFSILRRVEDYPWPGNVRELQNFVERVYALMSTGAEEGQFTALVAELFRRRGLREAAEGRAARPDVSLEDWERLQIVEALKQNNLVVSRTAEALGMSRTTLWRKLKEYKIKL